MEELGEELPWNPTDEQRDEIELRHAAAELTRLEALAEEDDEEARLGIFDLRRKLALFPASAARKQLHERLDALESSLAR